MIRFDKDLKGCKNLALSGMAISPINKDPYNVAVAYLKAVKNNGKDDEVLPLLLNQYYCDLSGRIAKKELADYLETLDFHIL